VRPLHRPGQPLLPTPKAGEKVAKGQRSQVGQALAQLEDRLPKELKLAGITTVEAANRFLEEVYLPEHNARFAVAPEDPETAFVADAAGLHRDILCVQEERVVGNDHCVRYRDLSLQIPPSPARRHFVKLRVRVHDYPDGMLAVFHGPRCLARYRADGGRLDHAQPLAA